MTARETHGEARRGTIATGDATLPAETANPPLKAAVAFVGHNPLD